MALVPKNIAIIGGGPIGLFHAIQMAHKGHQVELFEKRAWPIDKVCGQGIMPSGVKLLESIGFNFDANNSANFDGIKYIDGDIEVEGLLDGNGKGVKRINLSQQLFEIAKNESNIKLHSKVIIERVERFEEGIVLNQFGKRFEYVFVCDGLLSPTRKLLGKTEYRKKSLRMGARVHIKSRHQFEKVSVFWKDGIEAYLTPVSPVEFEIAFLWYRDQHKIETNLKEFLFEKFPEFNKYLEYIEKDLKAYGPFNQFSSCLEHQNVFFLGDAYCFLDGITGEGLSIGFRSSEIWSQYLEKNKLIAKIKIKLIYWKYILVAKLALLLSRFPRFRRFVFKLFKKNHSVFDFVLAINDQ